MNTKALKISAAFFATVFVFGCHKEVSNSTVANPEIKKPAIQLPSATNPFSLRNVEKAKKNLAKQNDAPISKNLASSASLQTDDLPQYVYFKFNPNEITTEEFQALENDSTVKLLDFPFANAGLYNEDFALDENKKEQLTDGNIYGVTSIDNASSLNLVKNSITLQTEFLDTLALIPQEDTALQRQSFLAAGYTDETIDRLFGICLLKRPHGYVRYYDDEFKDLEPVRGMQVWGLVFGIPVATYTDGNGYYNFPWRFSAGTIMGTHAKNSRVNIKPFNTMGGFFRVMGQLITNFIVGSVHVKGWVSSCDMRSDVNFDFYDHKQDKYWSQILNAYYFHDQYAAQSGILNAPKYMVCYAHWADAEGFGSASTPMLYHLTGGAFVDEIIQNIFGNPVSGTLSRLIHGLVPDMTFRVCGGTPPPYYNARLAQTAFHELGHASMFRAVGPLWYLDVDLAERTHVYGSPGYDNWGKVQVAESWAEFIGTENALRRYPNGVKHSTMLGLVKFADALEKEDWFAEESKWIPNGVYFDLIDNTNAIPDENNWDNVGGSKIQELYNIFYSKPINMCHYRWLFTNSYPQYNQLAVSYLFNHYNLSCD